MKRLFHGMSNFTLDISQWDVSGVEDFVSNGTIVLPNERLGFLFSFLLYFTKIVICFVFFKLISF